MVEIAKTKAILAAEQVLKEMKAQNGNLINYFFTKDK